MNIELSGAEILIRSLSNHNINTIFGYQGSCVMLIMDCLYDNKEIDHILVRHEQGAVHAACGYAQLSGLPGVVLVTSGPAATNTLTGIADAMASAIPLVAITGQVSSNLLGTDAFQEVDIINLTTSITKWNYQIRSADQIAEVVSKALRIASSGCPGPVVLDITKDAQSGKALYTLPKINSIPNKYHKSIETKIDSKENSAHHIIIEALANSEKDILLVLDAECNNIYEHEYFCSNKVIKSNKFGVFGFGLPAAIGAKFAAPDKAVCLIAGSLGFQANIQELGVIKQRGIDLKIILFNNPPKDVFKMKNPDFIQLINAYDIKGERANRDACLHNAIQRMLNSKGSYLLEISG